MALRRVPHRDLRTKMDRGSGESRTRLRASGRQERSRWRGGTLRVYKSDTPVSLEGLTVARYDDVNMDSDVDQYIDEQQ